MLFTRISSGLDFLDASIGGLYANRCYLIRGPSQSGRTTAALQFLLAGVENGEYSLMISSDRIENVILKAEALGISLENYLTDNRLILMEYPREILIDNYNYKTIIELLGEIEQFINHYNCTRLVFDTLHPLLTKPREPHITNYIYSLMNSLEAMKVTTLVTTGEPNSQTAMKIIQLIEDASVGSFALSVTGTDKTRQRRFTVNKMVDRTSPPMSFKVKLEHGVGLTQEISPERVTKEKISTKSRIHFLAELPLHIGILDKDADTETQVEEIFHKESIISVFEKEDELKMQLLNIDCDLLLLNASHTDGHAEQTIRRIREFYPKLPVFLYAGKKSSRFTYKTARKAGADGLFIKPFVPDDMIGAFVKALTNYGTYDELIEKRSAMLKPEELPENLNGEGFPGVDSDEAASEMELLSMASFKELIQRQIFHGRQNDLNFALVAFKMGYISEIARIPHLPQGLELVKKVAQVVMSSLRGLDDKACRYMDKVIVILEDTDSQGARAFANRVVNELKSELSEKLNIQIGKHLNILTAVTVFPEDGDNINDLIYQVTDVSRNFLKLQS